MPLTVSVHKRITGTWKVVLEGRLDTSTYQIAEEKLQPLMTASGPQVVFDMSKVDYISSMGLRVIMGLKKAVAKNGGKLLMSELQPPVAKVFEIAQALPQEEIFASVEEADRYFDLMQKRAMDE